MQAWRRFRAAQASMPAFCRGTVYVQRPELVERFGYDTKFAMHAVRLGLQGVEYVETGKITLPSPDAQLLQAIRSGAFAID